MSRSSRPRRRRSSYARTLPLLAGAIVAGAAIVGVAAPPERAGPTGPFSQTLVAHDPVRHTMSLADGAHGTAILPYAVLNIDGELDYGVYQPDTLTAGIQGLQVGTVVDLGTQAEVAARYGFSETVGGGQGFASIHFAGDRLVIRKDLSADTFQLFTEGISLLHAPVPPTSVGAKAAVDHLYLARIVDRQTGELIRFAKILVTSMSPDDRVDLLVQSIAPR